MDSNKDKSRNGPRSESHSAPPQEETNLGGNVKVVYTKFVFGEQLSIVDDDRGGDPYNSTGAHCIIKLKGIADD